MKAYTPHSPALLRIYSSIVKGPIRRTLEKQKIFSRKKYRLLRARHLSRSSAGCVGPGDPSQACATNCLEWVPSRTFRFQLARIT